MRTFPSFLASRNILVHLRVILSRSDLLRYHTTKSYCSTVVYTIYRSLVQVKAGDPIRPGPSEKGAASEGRLGVLIWEVSDVLVIVKLPYVQRSLITKCRCIIRWTGTFGQSRSYGWFLAGLHSVPTHDAWVFCPKREALAHRHLNNDGL